MTTVKVKERPLLSNGEMTRAILDGRKTQTRRVINPQPDGGRIIKMQPGAHRVIYDPAIGWRFHGGPNLRCPYGQPGDRLWVRETFAFAKSWNSLSPSEVSDNEAVDYAPFPPFVGRLRPSIHMPRWASRITLEITNVRVERVQEISDRDALAEGCQGMPCENHGGTDIPGACTDCLNTGWLEPPTLEFMGLWDSLNAKRGFGWDVNPWVWAISFRRVEWQHD